MPTPLKRGRRPGAPNAWGNLRFDDLPPSPSKLFYYGRLTAPHRKFVDELIVSQDPRSAALNAGFATGHAAYAHLLKDQRIRCAIRERMETITDLASITAADIRRELKKIYEADSTEITGIWRIPCRHCWGENNRYQYTDPEMYYLEQAYSYGENGWPAACITDEFGHELHKHAQSAFQAGRRGHYFDVKGGGGYSRMKEINAECPQCHGIGDPLVYTCDTRYISEGARKIFRGVKVNGGRIEIVTLDRQNVLNILARDTQVGVERKELTINLPRTREEFDRMMQDMSLPELEMFVANMVTLAENEYSEMEPAGDEEGEVQASLPLPSRFVRRS